MITIHAMGDSLVTAYGSDEDNFIGGWGDHLWSFFDSKQVKVNVYAQGGRSSRSYLNEGRFIDNGNFSMEEFPYGMGPVCNRIKPGDYVLIQFCHNDDNSKGRMTYVDRMTPLGTPDDNGIYPTIVPTEEMKSSTAVLPEEYPQVLIEDGASEEQIAENRKKYEELLPTYGDSYYAYSCGATYKGYLKFYIDKIRELGATPVLITAAARQCFEDGKIQAVPGHHGNQDAFGKFPYIRAIHQLGEQEKVVVLDLFRRSCELLEMLGASDAKSIQSIIGEQGTIGEARYDRPAKWVEDYDKCWREQSFLRVDGTHQNRLGSYLFAAILADCIAEQIPELKEYVLPKSQKTMSCPERIAHRVPEIEEMLGRICIKRNIRLATIADLEEITAVEAVCFPPAEAADRESFRKRLEVFSNHFWLLEKENKIISIINGMATDIPVLVDEMFADASMHKTDGAWQMIFGVETLPEYRGQGCAKQLMYRVIEDTRRAGRKGLMLTCKEELIPYYEQFGYINEGKSMSKHGGAVWYDMRLSF